MKGSGTSLLGRDWLGRLRLDWGEVRRLHTSDALDSLFAKYKDLFCNELGRIKGVKAKLYVTPGAKPCFYRPRSIPYAIKARVDGT